eukprot:COSAG03_NODE_20159_length_323_cov_1.383929_1_plen_24_part_10
MIINHLGQVRADCLHDAGVRDIKA